jgi:aspartyl-tRNA(Asn)/glutamyl-tRNA(Gln) amidotransferase subunit C
MGPSDGSRFDEAHVRRLAQLARVALEPDEAARLSRDLEQIVAYVDMLAELDLEGVAPMTSCIDAAPSLRDDVPRASLTSSDALREAPRSLDGGFAVPAFVDEG